MRCRRLWRMHRPAGWRASLFLSGACGQIEGHEITTVEGLAARAPIYDRLQKSFLRHGAAQCGACTPGMLVSATALLEQNSTPVESEVMDAIGGVLCRCTGYRKIITAMQDACCGDSRRSLADAGQRSGRRLVRLDGKGKVDGAEIFGADEIPAGALVVRAIRCPVPSRALPFRRPGCFRGGASGDRSRSLPRKMSRRELLWRDSAICRPAGICRSRSHDSEVKRWLP